MLRIILATLLLAGCATTAASTGRQGVAAERRAESVKRMQDEFNNLTADSY